MRSYYYPSLTYLNISGSCVVLKHLNTILNRAPNLLTLIVDHTNAFECVAISQLSITKNEFYHGIKKNNSNLTSLSANHCRMEDDCFISLLWHLPNLKSLSVNNNRITLRHFEIVDYKPKTPLTLSAVLNHKSGDQLPISSVNCANLSCLDLSFNDLNNGKILFLCHPLTFPNLQSLSISNCALTETEINKVVNQLHLTHSNSLTCLDVSGYDLQEFPLGILFLKNLVKLNISMLQDVGKPTNKDDDGDNMVPSNFIKSRVEWASALEHNNHPSASLLSVSPMTGLDRERMANSIAKGISRKKTVALKIKSPRGPRPSNAYSPTELAIITKSQNRTIMIGIAKTKIKEKRRFAPNFSLLEHLRDVKFSELCIAHHGFDCNHILMSVLSDSILKLDLSYNNIGAQGATHIANNLWWLEELDLSFNKKIGHKAGALVFRMRNLKKISMANTGINNDSIYGLCRDENPNPLLYLDISFNDKIIPNLSTCDVVFRQLQFLEHLCARSTQLVNDPAIIKNIHFAKNLQFLDLRENKMLTKKGKKFLNAETEPSFIVNF
ncbi:hypothetical protein AKO1_010794 [Acrasis kona]|uniref:Uncharacterized protein n=1 Tax=Acrasis kona TaxID=1008807 RepID=A0AAW2YMH8_9EUKA